MYLQNTDEKVISMGIFGNKANPISEQTLNRSLSLVYYNIDRLSLVVNYHRIFYTGAASNLRMLIDPSSFPGTEQFKFKLDMMDKMRTQVKDIPQSNMINFDHKENMRIMDETLQKVSNNIHGVLEIYGDDLCVEFDDDLFESQHKEVLYRLFGECIGIANSLNAEIDKLESEFYLLYGALENIVPKEKLQSLTNMFKRVMELRFKA